MSKERKVVTIYDIAAKLQVSPSTVSRALKDHYSISKDTVKSVKSMAKKMGYRPNILAASLRKNQTNTIGVLISWINRPFISSLISGIEEEANLAGYNVIITQSRDSVESEIAHTKALYDSRIAGLIVSLAMGTEDYDHFRQFSQNNVPLVFVDRVAEEYNAYRVVIDNFEAGYMATKELIEQGCTRIAHFGGSQHRNIYRDRQKGYLAALRQYNIPIKEEYIVHCDILSFEEGTKASNYLMDLPVPPDGLFSSNDTAAVSAIQFAKANHISVPDDLAIIGFNNDPISMIVDPQLSTINHPGAEMGRISARLALKHKENGESDHFETTVLETELVVRASSIKKKVKV